MSQSDQIAFTESAGTPRNVQPEKTLPATAEDHVNGVSNDPNGPVEQPMVVAEAGDIRQKQVHPTPRVNLDDK